MNCEEGIIWRFALGERVLDFLEVLRRSLGSITGLADSYGDAKNGLVLDAGGGEEEIGVEDVASESAEDSEKVLKVGILTSLGPTSCS